MKKSKVRRSVLLSLAASIFCMGGFGLIPGNSFLPEALAQDINYELDNTKSLHDQLEKLPRKGPENAKIKILQFSDFQCPFCNRVESTLTRLMNDYPNDVAIYFVQYPLDFHKDAESAAKASYAALLQGKFWEMHDKLYMNAMSDDIFVQLAQELDLDITRFNADRNSVAAQNYVDTCKSAAVTFGLNGTPSFLINGTSLIGAQPYEAFKKVVDNEIERYENLAKNNKGNNLNVDLLYQQLVADAPKQAEEAKKQENAVKNQPDKLSKYYIETGKSPVKGNDKAPVTIVVYTDFECPFCQKARDTINDLMTKNPNQIRLVFKHFPLPFHNNALLAHKAAEAAKIQGKFWQYYEILYDNRQALTRDDLILYANTLNLDEDQFIADMDSNKVAQIIENDIEYGSAMNVTGTPIFFINGKVLVGAQPLESFQDAVNNALEQAKPYTKKKLSGEKLYQQLVKDQNGVFQNESDDTINVNIQGAPVKGPQKAPVTIVLFADFQCTHSQKFASTLQTVLNEPAYANKVKVVFKHRPWSFHPQAQTAAEAAAFAASKGKFWQMYDKLMGTSELNTDSLRAMAADIGLNPDELTKALNDAQFKAVVDQDIQDAYSIEIKGTPSFLINGKLFLGSISDSEIRSILDDAITKAKSKPAKKANKK